MGTIERINDDWHGDFPHSYGGKYRAYDHYEDVSRKTIDEAFKHNDIYSKFKQHKKPRHHNPVYVHRKRQLFQADTVKFNDPLMLEATGIPNLIVIIDGFTKMVWLYPLARATGAAVAGVLEDLFNKETPPEQFQTDAGKEFDNAPVRRVLKKYNVQQVWAQGLPKACFAERFNLTIQVLIMKRCRKLNTNNWTSDRVLGHSRRRYLTREHGTISPFSPVQAEQPHNQQAVREIHQERYNEAEEHRKKPKFQVGDTVRISANRGAFARGYHTYFTEEVWRVAEVMDNLPQPRYTVEDMRGEKLRRVTLNENELVAYTPPANNAYRVEKILRERRRKGKKEFLVRWLHYGPEFDSWEPEENLVDLERA